MAQPLIEFKLRPLAEIQPWGAPGDLNLSWFGLTDGTWWINAGDLRLFEYSSVAVTELGAPQYCDYQVVRLYEDLMDLLPHALEEVPAQLVPCISLEARSWWSDTWEHWMAALPDENIGDAEFALIDSAGSWRGRRMLDSAYLTPSFDLRIWSAQGAVHLEWDNRAKLVEDVCAWTAVIGSFDLPAIEFLAEVRDFGERFMQAMAERVQQVRGGALDGRGIRVDVEGLAREQVQRSRDFQERLSAGRSRTDWESVSRAMSALEERCA